MSDHRSRLENAADLEMAHGECETHASTMDDMMLGMDGEFGRMSRMGMGPLDR